MKRLGIERGKSFDVAKADPIVQKAMLSAPAVAQKLMQWKLPTLADVVNFWSMNTDTMGVYGNYYLKRAIIAQVGLGANLPEDAIYPFNLGDEIGRPLDGDNIYTLHFEAGATPPVNAFWSVTLYDFARLSGRQPAQSLRALKLDAVGIQSRWFARSLCAERKSWQCQGTQLVAGSEGTVQPDHAPVCTETSGADRPMEAAARRQNRAAARMAGALIARSYFDAPGWDDQT